MRPGAEEDRYGGAKQSGGPGRSIGPRHGSEGIAMGLREQVAERPAQKPQESQQEKPGRQAHRQASAERVRVGRDVLSQHVVAEVGADAADDESRKAER